MGVPVDIRIGGLVDLPTTPGALVVEELLQGKSPGLFLVVPLDLTPDNRVAGEVPLGVVVVVSFLWLPAQQPLPGDPVSSGYFSLAPEPW